MKILKLGTDAKRAEQLARVVSTGLMETAGIDLVTANQKGKAAIQTLANQSATLAKQADQNEGEAQRTYNQAVQAAKRQLDQTMVSVRSDRVSAKTAKVRADEVSKFLDLINAPVA